jgi:hypothetical protein
MNNQNLMQRPTQIWYFFYAVIGSFIVNLLDFFIQKIGLSKQTSALITIESFIISTVITLIFVWFIFQGKNWSRMIFSILTLPSILSEIYIMSTKLSGDLPVIVSKIFHILFAFLSIYFLFTKPSNIWFKDNNILKTLLKSLSAVVLLFILTLMFIKIIGVSYETRIQKINGADTKIEVKKVFGKKISEATINSEGFYQGPAASWSLFGKGRIIAEGQYKNGFWQGEWKDYDKEGNLIMVREFEEGKLIKLFMPKGDTLQEISKDKWPKYANAHQYKRMRAKNY